MIWPGTGAPGITRAAPGCLDHALRCLDGGRRRHGGPPAWHGVHRLASARQRHKHGRQAVASQPSGEFLAWSRLDWAAALRAHLAVMAKAGKVTGAASAAAAAAAGRPESERCARRKFSRGGGNGKRGSLQPGLLEREPHILGTKRKNTPLPRSFF